MNAKEFYFVNYGASPTYRRGRAANWETLADRSITIYYSHTNEGKIMLKKKPKRPIIVCFAEKEAEGKKGASKNNTQGAVDERPCPSGDQREPVRNIGTMSFDWI